MHKINFCGTLCFPEPIEGELPSRKMDIIYSFTEAHLIPMAGAATPLHVLYASKPALEWIGDQELPSILDPSEIKRHFTEMKEQGFTLDEVADYHIISADHAVDPDSFAGFIFEDRNDSLLYIAERLFKADHKKVVIWANNGIGVDSDGKSDGILRDGLGIACGCILDGEKYDQHQRGLPKSYQNSGHQHIHIAPTKPRAGFDKPLIAKLDEVHDNKKETMTLLDYREMVIADPKKYLPCIAVCVLQQKAGKDLPEKLLFDFYSYPNLVNKDEKMAGLARKTITEYSKSRGLDFKDKEFTKEQIKKTFEFYQKFLN